MNGTWERYSSSDMRDVWSDERRYSRWLSVELAAMRAAGRGVEADAVAGYGAISVVTASEVAAIEADIGHDVEAFVEWLFRRTPDPARRYIHRGLTSSDVVDTALALALRDASALIDAAMAALVRALARKAIGTQDVVCAGRTHGRAAEPTTYGLRFAGWALAMKRARMRVLAAATGVWIGKVSGPVGTYSHVTPAVEWAVLDALGMPGGPMFAHTQVVPRDRHAAFVAALALAASTMEGIATSIRLLSASGIDEVAEPARKVGSSSMPHKRNPVTCEKICGLARVVRGHALAMMESVALWAERDISHSSVERIVLPESTMLVEHMAVELARVVDGLEVNSAKAKNTAGRLRDTQGAFLGFVEAGMDRPTAREGAQEVAGPALDPRIPDAVWAVMRRLAS